MYKVTNKIWFYCEVFYMEFTNVLRLRRSCRSYQKTQISEAQLTALLETAALSPIGMGRYDRIQLRVVQDPEILDAINADFAASIGNVDAYPTYGAPTVIFVLTRREDPDILSGANAACIVQDMSLAATNLGLGSVYLLGVCNELKDSAQTAALLRIPPEYRITSALSVGYETEPAAEREPDLNKIQTLFLR